jgi:hypothetical protein
MSGRYLFTSEDLLKLGCSSSDVPRPSAQAEIPELRIVNKLIENESSISLEDVKELRDSTPGAFSISSDSSVPSSSRPRLDMYRSDENELDANFCGFVKEASSKSFKRLSDSILKTNAYSITHYDMSDFNCPSTCQFNCAERITLLSQRTQFEQFWGPLSDESSAKSKSKKEKLLDFFRNAYDKVRNEFKFYTHSSTHFPTKFEICEYAAAHCLGINLKSNRQWAKYKKLVQNRPLNSIGGELKKGQLIFNLNLFYAKAF